MKREQLARYLGDIDERLIQQALEFPNYALQHRQKRIKRILSVAAVIFLMISSFSVGAIAFAHETVIEVPEERLQLGQTNLALILPDNWKGQYGMQEIETGFVIYNKQIREAVSQGLDVFDGGVLFTIVRYDTAMTEDEFLENGLNVTAYRYILATNKETYILHYASDVQYDPTDEKQEQVYQNMMREIREIEFVVGE